MLARLAACPPDAERLVVAAAVLGNRCPLDLASRLAEIDDPLTALEQAIAAHLLQEQPTATERLVIFPHPLVRAAVYHDLGPARRAGLHARAAQLVEGEADALRHRVAAASGPDPRLAAELTTLAGRQAIAGAWTAAADDPSWRRPASATQPSGRRLVLRGNRLPAAGRRRHRGHRFHRQVATFSRQRPAGLCPGPTGHGHRPPHRRRTAAGPAWRHDDLAASPTWPRRSPSNSLSTASSMLVASRP